MTFDKMVKLDRVDKIKQGHHTNTVQYYQQPNATTEYIIAQAILLNEDNRRTQVDLAEDLHYSYVDQKVHFYIDGFDLKKTFNLGLDHYRVGFVSKEVKDYIRKEKYEALAYRRIAYAPTGFFKRNKESD